MPHFLVLSALLLAAACASPSAAGHKEKADKGYANSPYSETRARTRTREARAKSWTRPQRRGKAYRYYYYAYPYSAWGPFAGPPGL